MAISSGGVPGFLRQLYQSTRQRSVLKRVGQFRLREGAVFYFIFKSHCLKSLVLTTWWERRQPSAGWIYPSGDTEEVSIAPFTKCAVPHWGHASCQSTPKKRDSPGLGAKATTALAPEDSRRTPSLYSELSFWSQLYQARTRISACFFPFLTIKANMKTLTSPLEPTSPEISVLRQTLGALVHLYGFKAVSEVS